MSLKTPQNHPYNKKGTTLTIQNGIAMTDRFIEKKIPGGKLLKISIRFADSIEAISITGDFFLHPEETLTEIEHALLGLPTKTTPLQFQSKIDQVLSRCDAQFIGLSSQDIAQTISEALYG